MYIAIVFLPLISALISAFGKNKLGDKGAQIVTCTSILIVAILSTVAFWEVALNGQYQTIKLLTWIKIGSLEVNWALRWDSLTAVMVIVISVISFCVHLYSIEYMSDDPSIARFMSYLSLFTFAMLMLVTSDNLIQLFFGWESVGVMSYLLIGFWYDRSSANAAAIKAFLMNRIGDFGFLLGIFSCFVIFDSLDFNTIFMVAPKMANSTFNFLFWKNINAVTVISIMLFLGAMGKSAQLGLHTWLPDAMEGPTPVSALIHAATMVTAGVFLVARMSPLFEFAPEALVVVTYIGAATAFFAATIALIQNDIKRVIAYSTCSQLGYMFFALGVSAYPAAIFHLVTHAFFKALLFLSAGSVIHAINNEQNMKKMGGMWRKTPWTYVMFWIGTLALIGIPFFAGYYSKDTILESAFASHTGGGKFAFWMGIVTALLTAFYSCRLLFMTFHGKSRINHYTFKNIHDPSPIMLIPLLVLAVGALLSGIIGYKYFVGTQMHVFWGSTIKILEEHNTIKAAHHYTPNWVKLLPILVAFIGISLAYIMYILQPSIPNKIKNVIRPLQIFLLNKWFFDELYNYLFVRNSFRVGWLFWKTGDNTIINGFGPDGISMVTKWCAKKVSIWQTGYLYHYAFAILIGLVALISWQLAFGS
ncbi:proton-translocating NADH-quinone oxidoreductase, chain L family protein [Candidatus Endolissoclinum faulkneri L2]|uniref:NADH-ubiquinone oxidoreductase chain 5 n=1 Tax=Candidatus Endolissoclinum faulkneri L2 TaxID=1193729 RepID=K7Z445_9PROT|nr:NADH-quinone oxidoreductase subunit L [Candidatus Endolissoclinum faulkneri]AFX98783.1 proton-translocating NADH-quinone oxidoreductase, chain L family protein [Candidatus Endolissoclinum faulkneri L2]